MRYLEENLTLEKKIRGVAISTFVLYIIVLLWITIFKCNIESSAHSASNFWGHMTIGERFAYALSNFNLNDGGWQMDLNVLIFVPHGMIFPFFAKRNIAFTTVITALLSTLTIECLQVITAFGFFTYSDLICNTLGAVIGVIIFAILSRILKDETILKALALTNAMAVLASAFAIINTILNIDLYI